MQRYVPRFATIGLLAGATTTNAIFNSVGGEAFGVSANAVGVRVGPTPHVVLPPDGGMVNEEILSITVPNVAASTIVRSARARVGRAAAPCHAGSIT